MNRLCAFVWVSTLLVGANATILRSEISADGQAAATGTDASAVGLQWMEKEDVMHKLDSWLRLYGADLERTRAVARKWKGKPQSDDLEMAMSYLRLRATKPKTVWECAPADGWSSLFILAALRDNNNSGALYSFGLESEGTVYKLMTDCCPELAKSWQYRQGKLETFLETFNFKSGHGSFTNSRGKHDVPLPAYVYIDALHTYGFGQMYARDLFAKLPHAYVSMHDVYRDGWTRATAEQRQRMKAKPHQAMPEAQGAFDALTAAGRGLCGAFTFSRSYSEAFNLEAKAIYDKHVNSAPLHPVTLNPTLYFELRDGKC